MKTESLARTNASTPLEVSLMRKPIHCLFLLVLSAGLVLSGCKKKKQTSDDQTPPKEKRIKIGFVVKQPEEPWFQLEWKFAQEAAKDLGFELLKIAGTDGEKVLSAIDNLAAGGAQGMIICTPDVKLGPAIVNKTKMNGLKLLAVDDQFVGPDGKFMTEVPYLGISARKIGQKVGKELYAQMETRGWSLEKTACCVGTFDELDTARERTEGAIEALIEAGFPKDKIFRAPHKTSDIPGAFDATHVLLTQHANVERWLVCGMNDSAVLGAIRAMEGIGLDADHVIGIGINGTDCIGEFQKEDPTGFYGSILLCAKEHGYSTAKMMYEWIVNNVEPPKDTRTVGQLITRDNFEKVLTEQGIPIP